MVVGPWSDYSYFYNAGLNDAFNSKVTQGPIDIRVYPNPSSGGIFNFDSGFELIESATLFSTTGQLIRRDLFQKELMLDYSDIPRGLYMVRFDYAGGSSYERIIIE
jgi:hypothetical protein